MVDGRKVAPAAEAVNNLDLFRESLPETTAEPVTVLKILNDHGSPATMAMAGPRFFGFVIGGVLPVSLAANWLAAAWDQNSVLYQVIPATAVLEEVALEWLVDLFKLPHETGGAFVTGGTVANFTALAAAQHVVLERSDWNVEAEKTKRVIAGIQQDGICYCGGTVWQGQEAMRISVSSWATTEEDVEKSLTAMLRIAGNVE